MATAGLFGLSFTDMLGGTIDLTTDTFKAYLLNGFTANIDTMHYRSDIGAGVEITPTSGYTAGGVTLTGATLSYDSGTNEVRWSHSNPQWVTASFSASQLIVYKSRGGTSAADELVYWCDFGGSQTVTLGTFTYTVPATGAIAVTCS